MITINVERDNSDALKLSHRLVALHVAGITVLVSLVLATAIWMSFEHNRSALQLSTELVENEITSLRKRVLTLVKDYSIWNEGYDAVLKKDMPWLYSNIGSSVVEIGTFDLALFVVAGRTAPIGWISGSPTEGEADLVEPPLLQAILSLIDQPDSASVFNRTLFAEYRGAPWIFAISRMSPVAGVPVGTGEESLPRQIHGLELTQARLSQIGPETLMGNVSLSDSVAPGQASVPIVAHDGSVLAYVVWDPPRPGAANLRGAAVPLAMALGVATILSGISSFAAVRSARRLEKALQASEAADLSKTEFLSNVSHELRTPMNGVLGAAQLLQTTRLDVEQSELLTVLLSSANAQMSLISDLIDLSRIDAGTIRLSSEPFEPVLILREVSDMMQVAASKKEIRVETDWEALDGVSLFGDARAFRQILTNLIGNAVKFTERGTVTIRASVSDALGRTQVMVSVADTGPGIPDSALPRVFERFYQADSSMSRSAMGTGLGLAISHRLAQLMEGEIKVASKLGFGSKFDFVAFFERLSEPVEQHNAA